VVLKTLCERLDTYEPLHIQSPPSNPRRACVAIIVRWRRRDVNLPTDALATTVDEFLAQPWVKDDKDGEAEVLFMQRATRVTDRWSGHVAFPGGKNEAGETDSDTAAREVHEEIGLNLKSEAFIKLGHLDDREIISTYSAELMMVLVPVVYLQVTPDTPPMTLQPDEVASIQCK
ncbi:NUDIX hydrolase domain-like protein, partial [Radiomyces spectabilis]|uniref:NUDIX hydrolase domain-like protein n=1 Tax=Radiomyces spectabilis TaxID=64574 RepID=UPI002220F6DB